MTRNQCPVCGQPRGGLVDQTGPGFMKALTGEAGAVWHFLALFGLAMLALVAYIAVLLAS